MSFLFLQNFMSWLCRISLGRDSLEHLISLPNKEWDSFQLWETLLGCSDQMIKRENKKRGWGGGRKGKGKKERVREKQRNKKVKNVRKKVIRLEIPVWTANDYEHTLPTCLWAKLPFVLLKIC